MITLVVFSKDRAMQLDSLLRSMRDNCRGISHVHVVAKASSRLHIDAYKRLSKTDLLYDELTIDGPGGGLPLGRYVADALVHGPANPSDHVALAVDDMLFYRASDFADAAEKLDRVRAFVWSWRLGRKADTDNLYNESYWIGSPLTSDPDYGYTFHSDGAVYRTSDYVMMLDKYLADWRAGAYTPNDLEAAVASHRARWAPIVGPHIGPLKPTCITWQLNRVQTKYGSPAAEIVDTKVDVLAERYLNGLRVDNEKLYAMLEENAFRFNPPGARPTHVYASEEASRFWVSCIR